MSVTVSELSAIYKETPLKVVLLFLDPLNTAMRRYEINTPQRIRMFLAQVGHESGQLRYTEEIASGAAYEGRRDLGNTEPGDGVKYKGRGLIQLTGKRNYTLCGFDLDLPLIEHPELLSTPANAAMSAGWFWYNCELNKLCDAGKFEALTRAINGGMNGYADRFKLYQRALNVLKN